MKQIKGMKQVLGLLAAGLFMTLPHFAMGGEGRGCIDEGWCYQLQFPFGRKLEAIVPNKWLLSSDGVVLKNTDHGWVKEKWNKDVDFDDIYVQKGGDVYAVGLNAVIHFDGTNVHNIDVGTKAWWRTVGGIGEHIFLGGSGDYQVAHFDGRKWNLFKAPVNVGYLNDIAVVGKDDVYFVGSDGIVLHFDGKSLSPIDIGTKEWLNSIYVAGKDDIYVAGRDTKFMHFDGKVWHKIKLDAKGSVEKIFPVGDAVYLYTNSSNVIRYQDGNMEDFSLPERYEIDRMWMDDEKRLNALTNEMLVVFDGKQWKVNTPVFSDVFGFDKEHVVAVGLFGTLRLYNGNKWSNVDLGLTDDLFRVWGTSWNDYYLLGFSSKENSRLWHVINGRPGLVDLGGGRRMTDIWGSDNGNIFVSGDKGLMLHYDGHKWQKQTTGTDKIFLNIDGSAADDVWATVEGKEAFHWDGKRWSSVAIPDSGNYRILSVADKTHAILADLSDIYALDGKEWNKLQPEGIEDNYILHDLKVLPNGNFIAAGFFSRPLGSSADDGLVLTRINNQWKVFPPVSSAPIHAITAVDGNGVFAVGGYGLIAHLSEDHYKLIRGEVETQKTVADTGVQEHAEVQEKAGGEEQTERQEQAEAQEQTGVQEQGEVKAASAEAKASQVTIYEQKAADAVSAGEYKAGLQQLEEAQKLDPDPKLQDRINRIKAYLELTR